MAVTPHAHGYVIGSGFHMFVAEKIFDSYFSDRLTFSNIRSRTSPRIYRLALPLCAPETLYSLSKSRISVLTWNLPWNGASPLADQTSRIIAELERSECRVLLLYMRSDSQTLSLHYVQVYGVKDIHLIVEKNLHN